jgi:lipoate---protein ligase
MDTWRYLPLSTNNAAMNMAVDEAILQARVADKVPNTLRLYRWQPSAVSIGHNQNPQDEVYLDTAQKLGVDVVRRASGGGTVYHAFEGEITYAVIAKTTDLGTADITDVYIKIYGGIKDSLRMIGSGCDYSEGDTKNCPNLTVNGKKISGSSQTFTRGVVLQHGTLLRSVDYERMFQLLKLKGSNCTQAADIGKRKITSLETELGHKISPDTIANALSQGLRIMLKINLEPGELTPYEQELAAKLYKEKYTTKEWNLSGKTA